MKTIYLIGSLRNPKIPHLANRLRKLGFEVFDDWYSPGPKADDFWRDHEKIRGRSFKEALNGYAAQHILEFDKFHLDRCDMALMLMPAGKSGHLELGYIVGKGKPGYILFDKEPKRYDIMVGLATDVFFSERDLFKALKKL